MIIETAIKLLEDAFLRQKVVQFLTILLSHCKLVFSPVNVKSKKASLNLQDSQDHYAMVWT